MIIKTSQFNLNMMVHCFNRAVKTSQTLIFSFLNTIFCFCFSYWSNLSSVWNEPYSCSRMVSGDFSAPALLTLGNLVFLRISITSEFLLSSSPTFWPEVRWLHMKQKLVWCNNMLIEIDPCKATANASRYVSVCDSNNANLSLRAGKVKQVL